MSSAICPFCFHVHDFRSQLKCPETSFDVPEAYVSELEKAPPLWLMTVGFKGHGKTCFIAALTQVIEAMQARSSGFLAPLDAFTFKRVQQIRIWAEGGKVEESTAPGRPRPLLFHAKGLPGADSRCLVVYDVPGESFEDFDRVADYAPAMRAVQTVWFFVCLKDLQGIHRGRTLQELFAVYCNGMRRLRIEMKGRALIVVFTKFDQEERPLKVVEYLIADPLNCLPRLSWEIDEEILDTSGGLNLDEYRRDMKNVSDVLERFTRAEVRGGAGFLSMARSEEMRVAFAATSALGQDPVHGGGSLDEKARPFRVIDPYLWAAELEASIIVRRFHLVLDGSQESSYQIWFPKIKTLWHRLSGFAEVNVYFLGRSGRATVSGQPPPAQSPTGLGPRLIGPLFESLPSHDQVLIVTGGPIVDLSDFDQTDWPNCSLVVHSGSAWQTDGRWKTLSVHDTVDQIDEIIKQFSKIS